MGKLSEMFVSYGKLWNLKFTNVIHINTCLKMYNFSIIGYLLRPCTSNWLDKRNILSWWIFSLMAFQYSIVFFGFVAKRNQNEYFRSYNLRQKIVGKFAKLSDVGFPLECFSTGFLRFSSTNIKICILGGQLGNRLQNPSNSGIILKRSFSNFYILFLFLFYNLVLSQLWWREDMLKREKAYNYFVQDFGFYFFENAW